jgi:iron complex transport system substrate-binding protein
LRLAFGTVLGALLVVGMACGSSSNATDVGGDDSGDSGSEQNAEGAEVVVEQEGCGEPLALKDLDETGYPLDVTDDRGDTIELDAAPTRVVTLEWSYLEFLLALGVQPVGAADLTNYDIYVTDEPPVGPDVVDVGSRSEPSIETIRTVEPDLILTDTTRSATNLSELSSIAPVLAFDTYGAGVDQLAKMFESFDKVAAAVDKADEANQVHRDYADTIVAQRERIADADPATTEVVLSQGEGTIEAPLFRLFTDTSMAVQIAEQLCLDNVIDEESSDVQTPGQDYGYVSVTMEGLTTLGDPWFLAVAPTDAVEEFEERFGDNPLFETLPIVTEDRVRMMPEDTWFFGGPISGALIAERIADAITS